ncbi:hypothetical protein [Cytobacillus oceanisediminis]|uniref:hypothetical protein n=1 Tax=Cytobacillus oceanisediminis TaxID=665099 RepID=UPI0037354990
MPLEPVSNMFHVHFHYPKEKVEDVLIQIHKETGIGITGYLREIDESNCYFEVSLGDLYDKCQRIFF